MGCSGWLAYQQNPIQMEMTIWFFLLAHSLIKGFINKKP